MDPLSEVLSLLKPRSYLAPALDAGGAWALQFPAQEGIKFDAVIRGTCWLLVEGERGPHRLEQGDGFLLASGRRFVLASDLALPRTDAATIFRAGCDGVARFQGGGDCFLAGGRFAFSVEHADELFGSLPPVLLARAGSAEAHALLWALDLFAREIHEAHPGGSLSAEHLAHIMLIQVLRLHLGAGEGAGSGWLYALADVQLGAALSAMHAQLARPWTLGELARIAGMSRTSFSAKFKRVVGSSPIEYLTRWRMEVAGARLRNSESSVAAIANAVGYQSEAAFSTAFKRTLGHPPKAHRPIRPAGPAQGLSPAASAPGRPDR